MLNADEARQLSMQSRDDGTGNSVSDILKDIEGQIRKVATSKHHPARFINYFNIDWRQDHKAYNQVIHELEDGGYDVEYVPSFDDRDPADKPYLTIRW